MKQRNSLLILLLSLFTISIQAQQLTRFSLAVEGGSEYATGDMNANWNVRQDVGYTNYGWDYYNQDYGTGNSINSEMTMKFIGIKPEFAFLNNLFAITSGLRYTRMNSVLNLNSSSSGSYFFLRDNASVIGTELYKVKKINEDNDYLGVPLELMFLPFPYEYFAFYLKAGVELNYKFNTNRSIEFLNADMKPNQQALFNQAGVTPSPFYSTLYSAVGVRYGKGNGLKYNFEVLFPSQILTTNNSSLFVPRFYSGVKLSVQFPLKKASTAKPVKSNL